MTSDPTSTDTTSTDPTSTDPTSTEDRVAQLEAQVSALTARLTGQGGGRAREGAPVGYDRRALLRRGGIAAAAGLAGAAALPGLTGTAAAANGQPVVIGTANAADAGGTTSLTATNPPAATTRGPSSRPTFAVSNQATRQITLPGTSSTKTVGAPAMRITPGPSTVDYGPDDDTGVAGDMTFASNFLYFTHESSVPPTGTDPGLIAASGNVYTSYFANFFVAINPTRILDTRGNNKPSGTYESGTGRLVAGTRIVIDLAPFAVGTYAVAGSVTCVSPDSAGFLSVLAGDVTVAAGTSPRTSNLNYQRAQNLANGFTTATSAPDLASTDKLTIYTQKTTHVLLDIFGFYVPDYIFVNSSLLPGPGPGSTGMTARMRAMTASQRAILHQRRAAAAGR